jgi:hypothetical protein
MAATIWVSGNLDFFIVCCLKLENLSTFNQTNFGGADKMTEVSAIYEIHIVRERLDFKKCMSFSSQLFKLSNPSIENILSY